MEMTIEELDGRFNKAVADNPEFGLCEKYLFDGLKNANGDVGEQMANLYRALVVYAYANRAKYVIGQKVFVETFEDCRIVKKPDVIVGVMILGDGFPSYYVKQNDCLVQEAQLSVRKEEGE